MTAPRPEPKPVKKKFKSNFIHFRKNDPTHNLIAATQHWIEANGGTALVLGSIGLMYEGEFKYSVCMHVVGRPPKKELKNAD